MKEFLFCELMNRPSTMEEKVEFSSRAKVKGLAPESPDHRYIPFLVDDGIQDGYIYVRSEALGGKPAEYLLGKTIRFKGFTGIKVRDSEMPMILAYQVEECVYA